MAYLRGVISAVAVGLLVVILVSEFSALAGIRRLPAFRRWCQTLWGPAVIGLVLCLMLLWLTAS